MTPAMQQFHEVKAEYPDHIVLFRMGDFYETFYEDAKKAASILNITLTARDREKKVPMAGIPFHALDNYLSKLVESNQKVVIVEQLEDPSEAKGVVKRGIVKIVTPGTNTLEKNTKNNNYLLSLSISGKKFHLSFIDLIEGKIYHAIFDDIKDLQNNILVLDPKEIIYPDNIEPEEVFTREFHIRIKPILGEINSSYFAPLQPSGQFVEEVFEAVNELKSDSVFGLLNYLAETQKTDLKHITKVIRISTSSRMNLDANAIRNLELIEGSRRGSTSLFYILDKCSTASGSKLLKNWIVSPLLQPAAIEERLQSIESLKNIDSQGRDSLEDFLCQVHDLSRISSKIGLSTANARDLRNSLTSIKVIFKLITGLKSLSTSPRISKIISFIEEEIRSSQSVLAYIDKTITEDPPTTVREGGMIRRGVDSDLDKLHDLKSGGKDWLKSFEQEEIKRSGISTLKVRFNKVFGYYIEVSKGQSSRVPDYFIRKQTLVNAERYITPELKEQEANILGADDRICKIEFNIFTQVLNEAKKVIPSFQIINELISEFDIYLALAKCTIEYGWNKPEVNDGNRLVVLGGRHPVIEYLQKREGKTFTGNSIELNDSNSLQIITGPNMGGKSTFIRQIALITLLAQIGSFVPAAKAEIGIVDRIFTRVGASDNLSQGESTFMVEMLEVSEILENATEKSLIILDEIGRGTSTFDGMSIAWAICEYIQKLNAKCLFATHYHELTELANKYKNVRNLSVKVIEHEGEILFMHQIIDGKADKSYGIHVAKLANLPKEVIKNAQHVLKLLEKEKNKLMPKPHDLFAEVKEEVVAIQVQNTELTEVEKELKNLDINSLTPIGAIQKISEWKEKLR